MLRHRLDRPAAALPCKTAVTTISAAASALHGPRAGSAGAGSADGSGASDTTGVGSTVGAGVLGFTVGTDGVVAVGDGVAGSSDTGGVAVGAADG